MLKRKSRKAKNHEYKRLRGRSINERLAIVAERTELGNWKAATIIGRRNGIERVTDHYRAIHIP